MKEKPRISRLTAIITQLQSSKIVTARELADKHNVSTRTIYRDIRTLESSGIPIYTEEGRGFSLVEGYQLPPIMFNESEANALITAEQMILKNQDTSFIEQYKSAITKIKAVLKHSEKEKADLLSERLVIRKDEVQKTSTYLMGIQKAVTSFNLLELEYRSLKDEFTKRVVEPFALYSAKENWLLIAFCRLRKEFRAFRIDHMQRVVYLKEHFEPHDITLEQYFEICRQKNLQAESS